MKNERISIMMPQEFEDTMENLMTIFSPTQDLGVTVAGEGFLFCFIKK